MKVLSLVSGIEAIKELGYDYVVFECDNCTNDITNIDESKLGGINNELVC